MVENNGTSWKLEDYESDQLRGLLLQRNGINTAINDYLIYILGKRGMDAKFWGVTSDLKSFISTGAVGPTLVSPPVIDVKPEESPIASIATQ